MFTNPFKGHLDTITIFHDGDLLQCIVIWLSHRSQEALHKWRTQAKLTQEKEQKERERQRKQEVCVE